MTANNHNQKARSRAALCLFAGLLGAASAAAQEPEDSRAVDANRGYLFPAIPAFRSAGPPAVPRIVLRAKLPGTPSHLQAYELQVPTVDAVYIRRLAKSLEINPLQEAPDGDRWEISDSGEGGARRSLTVFIASGSLVYSESDGAPTKVDPPPRIADDRRAFDIALRFLKERNLLPSDAQASYEQVHFARSTLIERAAKEKRNLREVVMNVDVRFTRAIDGYRVRGPGAKLYVTLGDGNQIVGVTRAWRELGESRTRLPVIRPDEAIALLQRGAGQLDADPDCTTAEVSHIEIVYWMDGPRAQQRTLLPAYRLEGRCLGKNRKVSGGFQAYAPAVRNAGFGSRRKTAQLTR